MSNLLHILRDIYIRCVSNIANQKYREYLDKYCFGCREPECASNQMAHDICVMMDWDDQLITYLPDILKDITPTEISEAILTAFNQYQRKDSLLTMLRNNTFCVSTFLFICQTDMLTDLRWQTRIAQTIFKKFEQSDDEVQQFGKRYYTAAVAARNTTARILLD